METSLKTMARILSRVRRIFSRRRPPGSGLDQGPKGGSGPCGAALGAVACALFLTFAMFAPVATATPVTFQFRPTGPAQTVSVAGTMNEWNTTAAPLQDEDGDGLWTASMDLSPGSHMYKFVVNGNNWITDETAAEFADDGFGGKNSVLTVGDAPMVVGTASAGGEEGIPPAAADAIAGAGENGTTVTFRFQPVIGGVNEVAVAGSMNGWDPTANLMTDDDEDGIWETTLELEPGDYQYKFVVNGDQWFPDDFAMDAADDGFGGENSIIRVGNASLITGPGGNVAQAEEAGEAKLREVTFTHRPGSAPQEIVLAGTMNDWKVGATPMADDDGDGEYQVTLLLSEGEYQYKFVIDGNWTTDRDKADSFVDDGFGGENSVVSVDDRFPAIGVALGDGIVTAAGVDHRQTATEVNNIGNGLVEITVKAHRNDIEGLELMLQGDVAANVLPLEQASHDGAFAYWRGRIELENEGSSFRYLPVYHDGGTVRYLHAGGLSESRPEIDAWFGFTPEEFPSFDTPDWVKDAVIYQIFVDRFQNGDAANDQDFSEWYYQGKTTLPESGKTNGEYYHLTGDWYDTGGLTTSPYRTDGKPDYFSFYGGDMAGVRQGLQYLQDLGVTAIYFNPIAEAKSNHKYDCADYLRVDPHFGTNREFKEFVAEAHNRGIRIILDIVFNHTGNSHWAFADAAKNGPQSESYGWYEFKKWPLPQFVEGGVKPEDFYACWWGFGDLPDLNFDLSRSNAQENNVRNHADAEPNQPLIDHLMRVVDFWIGEMDADGVRLDVANEVPFWFWTQFNDRVKTIKKDAYIVGEIWGDASDWISPNMFDATMNYAFFRDPVTKFIGQGKGTAAQFDRALAAGRLTYPTQSVQAMMNLLGSHDTVRYRQQVGGDLNRVKLSYLFSMTYVGAPHIYYGDEIGMTGGRDPDCRRPFLWNWDQSRERVDLHDYVKKLANLRAREEVLRRGDFTTLEAKGSAYTYLRTLGDEKIVVALNAGTVPIEIQLDPVSLDGNTDAMELLTGAEVDLSGVLTVQPSSGMVLKLR